VLGGVQHHLESWPLSIIECREQGKLLISIPLSHSYPEALKSREVGDRVLTNHPPVSQEDEIYSRVSKPGSEIFDQ
jgi:hypothetical protein